MSKRIGRAARAPGASNRRRKLAISQAVCFAVVEQPGQESLSLTLFSGRRALTRMLSPEVAEALARLLSRSHPATK